MGHSAIGLVPKEARKPENELKAKVSFAMNTQKAEKYPALDMGRRPTYFGRKII